MVYINNNFNKLTMTAESYILETTARVFSEIAKLGEDKAEQLAESANKTEKKSKILVKTS